MIEKEIAGLIFGMQYWLRAIGVPKSKWKRRIVNRYVDSGMSKKFKVHSFHETWDELHKLNLVERR